MLEKESLRQRLVREHHERVKRHRERLIRRERNKRRLATVEKLGSGLIHKILIDRRGKSSI